MHVNEAIQLRRSIKHFDPNHIMTKEEIHILLSNAVLSPTAFNIQNWRFVVVTDKDLRQKIREVSWGQAQVEEASILIVLVADLMAGNWIERGRVRKICVFIRDKLMHSWVLFN
jgi:nitroreductase